MKTMWRQLMKNKNTRLFYCVTSFTAGVFGSVNFVTLDGFMYSFNGIGEYSVLEIDGGVVTVQTRTERVTSTSTVARVTAMVAQVVNGKNDILLSMNCNATCIQAYCALC